jgi:hypothetical protein
MSSAGKGKGARQAGEEETWRLAVQRVSRGVLEQLVLKALADGTVSLDELGPPPKMLKESSVSRAASFTVSGTGAFDRLGDEELSLILVGLGLRERITALSAVCKGWLGLRPRTHLWRDVDVDDLGMLTGVGLMKLPRVIPLAETSSLRFTRGDRSASLAANDLKRFFTETPLPALKALALSHKKLTDTMLTGIAKKSASRLTSLELTLSSKARTTRWGGLAPSYVPVPSLIRRVRASFFVVLRPPRPPRSPR